MRTILIILCLIPVISFSQIQIGEDFYGSEVNERLGRSVDLS